jgi:hypothetical protein
VRQDHTWGGWAFEGDLVRPGSVVELDGLPEPAVVLECAGTDGAGQGHRRSGVVYVLWRLDRQAGEFRELARVVCENRDWTVDLGPIARRELAPSQPVLVDPKRVCERICGVLDEEMDRLHRDAQRILLLALYDRLAARVVELPGPPAPIPITSKLPAQEAIRRPVPFAVPFAVRR